MSVRQSPYDKLSSSRFGLALRFQKVLEVGCKGYHSGQLVDAPCAMMAVYNSKPGKMFVYTNKMPTQFKCDVEDVTSAMRNANEPFMNQLGKATGFYNAYVINYKNGDGMSNVLAKMGAKHYMGPMGGSWYGEMMGDMYPYMTKNDMMMLIKVIG